MKEFLHHGEKVFYQEVIDESFLNLLNKSGIIPEELPDGNLDYRVFQYEKDNQKRYACVIVANAPGAYVEKVYITYKIPCDGFYRLMLDVSSQLNGEKPKKIESRLHAALSQARKQADQYFYEKYPDQKMNFVLFGYGEKIQEYNNMIGVMLTKFGYNLQTLEKVSAPDVDIESVKKYFETNK